MLKKPHWVVVSVTPHDNYTLLLTFADGAKKVYDAKPLLSDPLFAPLKNQRFFMLAKKEGPSVAWPGDLDIAPEHLYEASTPFHE